MKINLSMIGRRPRPATGALPQPLRLLRRKHVSETLYSVMATQQLVTRQSPSKLSGKEAVRQAHGQRSLHIKTRPATGQNSHCIRGRLRNLRQISGAPRHHVSPVKESFGERSQVARKELLEMGIAPMFLRERETAFSEHVLIAKSEFIQEVKEAVLRGLQNLLEESR